MGQAVTPDPPPPIALVAIGAAWIYWGRNFKAIPATLLSIGLVARRRDGLTPSSGQCPWECLTISKHARSLAYERTTIQTRIPHKGMKIEYASTSKFDLLAQVASDFMQEILDLEPGSYVISDESSLRDFTDFGLSSTLPIWK